MKHGNPFRKKNTPTRFMITIFLLQLLLFAPVISANNTVTNTNLSKSTLGQKITTSLGTLQTTPPQSRGREMRTLKKEENTSGLSKTMSPSIIANIQQTLHGVKSQDKISKKSRHVSDTQLNNLQTLTSRNNLINKAVSIHFNKTGGTPTFLKIGTPQVRKNTLLKPGINHDGNVRSFLNTNRNLLALSDPETELTLNRKWDDNSGSRHYRYQQTHKGIAMWGKEAMVHLDSNGDVYLFNGHYAPTPSTFIQTVPEISSAEAFTTAVQHINKSNKIWTNDGSDLVIYTTENGDHILTYKIDISAGLDNKWIYFVDALNNNVVHRISNIFTEVVTAQGTDLGGTTRTVNAWHQGGTYYLVDPTTPLDTAPYGPISPIQPTGYTYILDMNNLMDGPLNFISSSSQNSGWDAAGISAMANIKTTHDYYKNTHERNGIDNNNMNYEIIVHLGQNYANAFWNGKYVVFGDGDGSTFRNLAGSLDVTAHEIQHGITQFTANLIYENQSGALNEAYSDIMACMVDDDDWTVGEEITIASPGYLRNLANPSLGLSSLPSKMSEYRNMSNTEDGDWGGVHINMSIPSRAAYLIADGLDNEGLGTPIGRDKTAKIFYRALTQYLSAYSQFIDARRLTIQAAEDLHGAGSAEVLAVQAGWNAVEVTESGTGSPDTQEPTPADTISGQDLMAYIYPNDLLGNYNVHIQTLPAPFPGYDSTLDIGPYNQGETYARFTKPAVYTGSGGTVIFYVDTDYNLYSVRSDQTDHRQITDDGDIWSIAISPDGNYFAYSSAYNDDNNIYVIDVNTGLTTAHELITPSTEDPNSGGTSTMNTIKYADSLAFDYMSTTIVFDALNCLSTPDNSCDDESEGGYPYWSIGFLNLSDGSLSLPFQNQNPNYNLSYPSFAYNNNYVIALDVIDYTDTVLSSVWTLNLKELESYEIINPDMQTTPTGVFGVPTFWGNDDYLTIRGLTDSNSYAYRIPINSTWEGDESLAMQLNDNDVYMPLMHRAGVRTLDAVLKTSVQSLVFDKLAMGQSASKSLTISNTGNRDIEITSISLPASGSFSHNGTNAILPRGESMVFDITYTAAGTTTSESSTLTITSDADTSTLNIPVTAPGDDTSGGGGGGGGCFITTVIELF